jgi:quercetin dioxygenase-like cupin family protein
VLRAWHAWLYRHVINECAAANETDKEEWMESLKRVVRITAVFLVATGIASPNFVAAQRPSLKRTEVLKTEMDGMEGSDANMWIADIAPGAETGKHSHPTPRFVYVMEGSVIVEMEGKSPQTFNAGEGFKEVPATVHNFKNASATQPAKALGFQIAKRGQPLQY